MTDQRLVKQVYKYRKQKLHPDENSWCWRVATTLNSIDLLDTWFSEDVGDKENWNSVVFDKLKEREQNRWRQNMKLRPKLEIYRSHKQYLCMERYLKSNNLIGGARSFWHNFVLDLSFLRLRLEDGIIYPGV